MINPEIFKIIEKTSWQIEKDTNQKDIILAFLSELGEIAHAIRVENNSFMVHHKTITESSLVEIVDGIMILTELFVRRGGTLKEMDSIVKSKIQKWQKVINDS